MLNDIFDALDDIAGLVKEQAKFHPADYNLIYKIFSQKINEKTELSKDEDHIYFTCGNNPKLSFKIHQLQFKDTSGWMHWQREAIQQREANMNGIYTMAGTFYGAISTEKGNLEVITKDNRLIDIRKIDLGKLAGIIYTLPEFKFA